MISSCAECTTKCCRSGPGPYKTVSVDDWLSHKPKGSERYNTKCEHFNEERGICNIWENAPIVCKVFVCAIRTYSKQELKRIDRLWKQYNGKN